MEHEPNSFIPGAELLPQSPRPCSTPHGAPLARLRDDAESPLNATEPGDPDAVSPQFSPERLADVAASLLRDPDALAESIGSLAPDGTRGDGWTPFARKLFLQVLADTGRVGLALSYAGLTKQSANALRNRDPLFAAGWDAAALIARNPLADEALEKSLDGITETVTPACQSPSSTVSTSAATGPRKRLEAPGSGAPLGRISRPHRQGRRGWCPGDSGLPATWSIWSTSRERKSYSGRRSPRHRPVRQCLEKR